MTIIQVLNNIRKNIAMDIIQGHTAEESAKCQYNQLIETGCTHDIANDIIKKAIS